MADNDPTAFGPELWQLGHPAYVVVHLREEIEKVTRLWKAATVERDALLARVEAAEKNAGRMREFLLAFINGGVNQDFRLWASEVLSDMEDGT